MVKTRKIKVKSIEDEEIIMAITVTKTIITKIIIIMMRMRIKIGNHIKNQIRFSYFLDPGSKLTTSAWPGFGTQLCCKAAGDFQVK